MENKINEEKMETAENMEQMPPKEDEQLAVVTESEEAEKKNGAFFSNFMNKASDIGKKAADGISKGAKNLSEQTKKAIHDSRMKKYKPLFMKDFRNKNFNIPNLIKIVDDAVRRDIDVCKGAIGWTGVQNNTEVLFLYDEAVKESGIEFVPDVGCDQLYYVDHFDRNRFIKVNCVFERAHSERLAELEHIAYSLGAKSCRIEIEESVSESYEFKSEAERKANSNVRLDAEEVSAHALRKNNVNATLGMQKGQTSSRSGKARTYFEGNDVPTYPNLKWFANDNNIKGLIEMRCSGNNTVKSRTLILSGATTTTMSQHIACTIDDIMEADLKVKKSKSSIHNDSNFFGTMSSKAIKESRSDLIFEIEF